MNLPVIIALSTFLLLLVTCIYEFSRRHALPREAPRHKLDRHPHNPVISPVPYREWEANGTFNPAAVEDSSGRVHLFYRAVGADGLSRISHAVCPDGRRVSELSPYAVYEPVCGAGMPSDMASVGPRRYDIVEHPSGGGWGGSEDPRTTKIGDRVYMTYTAFEGWDNMRIGLTSISVKDMEKGRWNWRRPRLISPAKARNKNWVLFPEKINGKYALLHGIAPKIYISYLDSLDMVPPIQSCKDHGGYGHKDPRRKGEWDEIMKGVGTPPVRTDLGWLILYHAIHDGKYKVGGMILDLNDPTKVLYRSPQPILAPDAHYENDGKPNVVYATGAVVKDGQLLVYYGGGDKHVCVAETPLAKLLDWMATNGRV